jgi:hypothetical protein
VDAPTAVERAYCRGCHAERRFLFAGYATETGAENTVRPRAEVRRCGTCGRRVLVLGDVSDGEALVATAIAEWRSAHSGDLSGLDLDDLSGYLTERLWELYLVWRPDGLPFRAYALGLLRRKLRGWVGDAAGGVREHRNGHGRTALRYPKAHSLAVSESYDGLVDDAGRPDDGGDRPGGRRLEFALGAFQADFADDRSSDLGGLFLAGDR